MRRQLTYEIVRKAFDDEGCTLVSTEYVKKKDKLDYICSCGNKAKISFDKFDQGQRCPKCKINKISTKQRHSFEYVKNFFASKGCELLSETYQGNKQKLAYRCDCGNKSLITFAKFQAGQRCSYCKPIKLSEWQIGKKSRNYDHSKTDEERIRDRKYPEYIEWRRKVYARDNYSCQCCGEKGGKLNAHHIESYSKNPHLRTDVNNGVTLCEPCHKRYHADFDRNDADEGSFIEFMSGDYREPPFADDRSWFYE